MKLVVLFEACCASLCGSGLVATCSQIIAQLSHCSNLPVGIVAYLLVAKSKTILSALCIPVCQIERQSELEALIGHFEPSLEKQKIYHGYF